MVVCPLLKLGLRPPQPNYSWYAYGMTSAEPNRRQYCKCAVTRGRGVRTFSLLKNALRLSRVSAFPREVRIMYAVSQTGGRWTLALATVVAVPPTHGDAGHYTNAVVLLWSCFTLLVCAVVYTVTCKVPHGYGLRA